MDTGTALLCVLNDLADGCDRADYEAWYQRDHLPDRLSVPGFRHARRYRRLRGPQPEYLTFYETDSPTALGSAAYAARLAQPTEWTRRMMPQFRAMSRTACRVAADTGGGIGGVVALVGTGERPGPSVHAALAGAVARPAVTRARLWRADPDAALANPEARLRPGGDTSFPTILLVEGTEADAVGAAAVAAARSLGLTPQVTLYALLFAASTHPTPGAGETP